VGHDGEFELVEADGIRFKRRRGGRPSAGGSAASVAGAREARESPPRQAVAGEADRLRALWRDLIESAASLPARDPSAGSAAATALRASVAALDAALAGGTLLTADASAPGAGPPPPAAVADAVAAAGAQLDALADEEAGWSRVLDAADAVALAPAPAPVPAPAGAPSPRAGDATGVVRAARAAAARELAVAVEAVAAAAARADAVAARAEAEAAALQADWRARRLAAFPGVDSPAALIRGLLAPPR